LRWAQGCIGPVENQGTCGSCWSFAISATIADTFNLAAYYKDGKCSKFSQLSQEELLNCADATGSDICGGGSI